MTKPEIYEFVLSAHAVKPMAIDEEMVLRGHDSPVFLAARFCKQVFGKPDEYINVNPHNNPYTRWGVERLLQHVPGGGSGRYVVGYRFWFKREEDATMFQLRCGEYVDTVRDWHPEDSF